MTPGIVKINELTYIELLDEMKRGAKLDITRNYTERLGLWKGISKEQEHRWREPLWLCQEVMRQMCEQEREGVLFDKEKAIELLAKISQEMTDIADKVEPLLGDCPYPKSQQPQRPAKPFKQDGTLSQHGINYGLKFGLTKEEDIRKLLSNSSNVLTKKVTLSDTDEVKSYLVKELGWNPTMWRTKDVTTKTNKSKRTKDEIQKKIEEYQQSVSEGPFKKFIEDELGFSISNTVKLLNQARALPTTPQFKEVQSGRMCSNLEDIASEIGKDIILWYSLRNRRGVLTGWLENGLRSDGKLSAGSSGPTNTYRQKHRTVANIPKAEEGVVYGKEMRSLFIAPPGKVLVGTDAAQLENRIAGHFTYYYDGGEYARELVDGDVHTRNAEAYSLAAGKEITRTKGKNLTYMTMYGAQPPLIAKSLGVKLSIGKQVQEAFWGANTSLKQFKDTLIEYWESTGRKYLIALDGRKIYTRSEHSLLNAMFQTAGAIVMDRAMLIQEEILNSLGIDYQRVWYYHDESGIVCDPKDADTVGKAMVDAIRLAGEYYNLNIELAADYSVGKSWCDVH